MHDPTSYSALIKHYHMNIKVYYNDYDDVHICLLTSSRYILWATQDILGHGASLVQNGFKDGAYYCYCAYVLHISRYSDFLSPMLTNTGIFLRGLKLSGESRSY